MAKDVAKVPAVTVPETVYVAGKVVRTRTARQSKTNIVLVATGNGKAHTVACFGAQPALVTTEVLAVINGATPEDALPNGTASQRAALAAQAANAKVLAVGHNVTGVTFPSKQVAKPMVYVPASWCPACAGTTAQTHSNNVAAVVATALPTEAKPDSK